MKRAKKTLDNAHHFQRSAFATAGPSKHLRNPGLQSSGSSTVRIVDGSQSQPSRNHQGNSILLTPNGHETLKPPLRFVVVSSYSRAPAYRLDVQRQMVARGARITYVNEKVYARSAFL